VGIGLQDAAVGRLLLDAARERGLGTEISLAG
jgi:ornithine cyclodeaminase/alanine dehydrogenase